jgi:ABC-type glycerol-3-phosphate transport system substrate-binding protein
VRLVKAMTDGLVLFHWAPDWRSWIFADEAPALSGKMALMPLPAWTPGGRRTSTWGGTGLMIMKQTRHPDLAWELAKYLYFDTAELGQRFLATNILPPLKDAWNLPEFATPFPYYSNQRVGQMYAALAPQAPPVYSSSVDDAGRLGLDRAFNRSAEYYARHGENGLLEEIRSELAEAAEDVRRLARRERILAKGTL